MKELYKHEVALVGEKIKNIRTNLNISQQELAYRAEVDIRTIQRAEKGEYGIGLDVLFAIANSMDVDPTDFFKD